MQQEQDWVLEVPLFRDLIQMGVDQGIEKGRQEELTSLRRVLLTLVKGRFPELTTRARTQASHMKSPEVLMDMIEKVGLATTHEEVLEALSDWRSSAPAAKKSAPLKKSKPE